jgi:5S rRNA maturation endonuclease (ribonuclease M5)
MDVKLRNRTEFQNSVLHNSRKEKQPKDNIDYSRTKNNYYIFGSNNETQILSKHLEETKESRKQKNGTIKGIRKDANLAISFVFSASPEHFFDFKKSKMNIDKWNSIDISNSEKDKIKIAEVWKTLNEEKVKEFENVILEHMKAKHGNNLISIDCHRDEKGIHFHCLTSCRVDSPKGKKLSAKEYYTRTTLAEWNADIRPRMQAIGLEAKKEEPEPPIPTDAHHSQPADEVANDTPRLPVPPLKKGVLGVYKSSDVDARLEIHEQRERALKKDNSRLKRQIDKMNNSYVNHNNLKNQHSIIKKENAKMKNKLYKMTEDEKEDLRSISCSDVLKNLGFVGKTEGTTTRFKNEEMNIVVDEKTNKFIDNKTGQGGYGAIDILINQFNYKFKEAIDFLSSKFTSNQVAKIASIAGKSDVKKFLEDTIEEQKQELPKVGKEFNFDRVKDYLINQRKVSSDIVNNLIDSKLLYADKNNNCVFINQKQNFAFLRGTVANKKFVANKGKVDFLKYEFNNDNSKNVFLFESVIDALSFKTSTGANGTYIVFNGSGMINRIDELQLQKYNKVFCCFDKDEQGNFFDDKIQKALPNAIVLKPNLKDFNEDLINGNTTTSQYTTARNLANAEAIAREAKQTARNSTDRNQQTRFKIS